MITLLIIFSLLIYLKTAIAYNPLAISETTPIPLFNRIFLAVMAFQISLTIGLLSAIKRYSTSKIWDYILVGGFFCVVITLTQFMLINKLMLILNDRLGFVPASFILIFSTLTYVVAHLLYNINIYYLIRPIIKKQIDLFQTKNLIFYLFFSGFIYFVGMSTVNINFPRLSNFLPFYFIALIFLFIALYTVYYLFYVSRSYLTTGFVYKPYLLGGMSGAVLILSLILLIFYVYSYVEANIRELLFFYVSFYLIACAFCISYNMHFISEYPALLESKWKEKMKYDLIKISIVSTLVFLAISFYFTAKEHPNFIIYQNIPYISVVAFLLPLFLGIILSFTYLKNLISRTKLRYWGYLKHGLYIHLTVTLYVFSLIFLSWNDATSTTKMLFAIFGLASFVFYMFFALDLRKILKDQKIKPIFDRLDISRYLVSLYSFFFLLFFGISFTYGRTFEVMGNRIELISYPVILFFIAFFLIAFISYLSVTHKGFEEIMRKNIWSELSYVSAFIAFLLVYLIYSSLSTYIQRFPYHDFFFIGFFLVLIIEIASIRTLGLESQYKKDGKEDIVHLLNSHAHRFLRTDYLEVLWEKTVDRYVREDEATGIRFDPSGRRFDLEKADEHTRLKIAVALLLGMHKLQDIKRITTLKQSVEETKEEIAEILKGKVLLLPEDLRCEFDESAYYPVLYEKVVNNLLKRLKAFIPFSEQEKIFDRLRRRDEKFKCIGFEEEEIKIKEGTMFSRDKFFELFKYYLESAEERFPFKRFLFYELIREEIKTELEPYDITVSKLLDIVPTGVEEMDEMMAGGLSKRSSSLLITEETKPKHKILLAFIEQGLREGNSVIYATSKRPAHQIMGELLIDFDELTNFMIIDLYENIYTEERVSDLVEEEQRIIVPLSKILFQRSIVKAIKSQPKEEPKIVVIDVYDDFSRYYSPGEILELLNAQIEGLKRWNCTSIISIDPYSYLIKKEGVEEVKKNFDNVMILSGEDKDASVFIEKLYHGTPSKHIIHLP